MNFLGTIMQRPCNQRRGNFALTDASQVTRIGDEAASFFGFLRLSGRHNNMGVIRNPEPMGE